MRLCQLAPTRRGQKRETRLSVEPRPRPHPQGLQGRLAHWGTVSRPGYQCPSGSTSHKNRKNWDKILHLPLIVSAQLFPRRRHPGASRMLLCLGLVSPPPNPDSQRREGAEEALPSGRAQATARAAARREDRP